MNFSYKIKTLLLLIIIHGSIRSVGQSIGIQGTLVDKRAFVIANNIESITHAYCEGRFEDRLCENPVITDSTVYNEDGYPIAKYTYDWNTWQRDSILYEYSEDTITAKYWLKSTNSPEYEYCYDKKYISRENHLLEVNIFWPKRKDNPSSDFLIYDDNGNLLLFGDTAKVNPKYRESWKYNEKNQVIEYRYDSGDRKIRHYKLVYNDKKQLIEIITPAKKGVSKYVRSVYYDNKTGLIDHWASPANSTEKHFIRYTFKN